MQCHWLLQKRRGDEYANRLELGVLVGRWRTHHARTHDTRLSFIVDLVVLRSATSCYAMCLLNYKPLILVHLSSPSI